ncbi:Delta2-dienoyl-CoA-isomerase [Marasmius fiardii PR-910]|nr:Delta2-dienoyl-CoA-isomerase [Marasmius fiardii PR-910]
MAFSAENLSSQWLKVSEPSPHVLHVQLSRNPVNAFSTRYWRAYGELFERITQEAPDVRVVVVSSALDRFFTAGLDLHDTEGIARPKDPNDDRDTARKAIGSLAFIKEFQSAINRVERVPFPVIAAIHGIAIGLGIDMTSCCDVRYAAEDASFSIKEVDIGIAADIGSLSYIPKVVGNISLVREHAYTGQRFSAHDAERMGYVSRVIPGSKDQVVSAALELAKTIASKSPLAVAGTKRLITHGRDHTVEQSLDYTAVWNAAMLQTEDTKEAVAATLNKRTPKFKTIKVQSKL